MKRFLFITILLWLASEAVAQRTTTRYLSLGCNIQQVGSSSGKPHVSCNCSDTGGTYDASNIAVGDTLYFNDGGVGYALPIDSIVTPGVPTLVVRADWTGLGLVLVPTGRGGISRSAVNGLKGTIAGLTAADNQYLEEDFVSNISGAISFVSLYKGTTTKFAADTDVAPDTTGAPSTNEIEAWNYTTQDTNWLNSIIFYTGGDDSTAVITYIYFIDGDGNASLLESPSDPLNLTRRIIPSPAFSNAAAPLDSEALTFINALSPPALPSTIFVQADGAVPGSGTSDNPETVWVYDGTNVTRIKDFPRKFEVPGSAFSDSTAATGTEVLTWLGSNPQAGNYLLAYHVGSGTEDKPDFAWFIAGDTDLTSADIVTIKEPGGGGDAALKDTISHTSHGFSVGNLINIQSVTGLGQLADADVDSLFAVGIITEVIDENSYVIQTSGIATISGVVAGQQYYTSSTAGAVTTTAPSKVQVAYQGISTNTARLVFDRFSESFTGLEAVSVSVTDAGGYYSSTDVENVLQEAGSDIAALQSSQNVGTIGFETKAIMDTTVTLYPANTVALVGNDGTASNNGYYRFGGSTWTKINSLYSNTMSETDQTNAVTGYAVEQYLFDYVDNITDTSIFTTGFYNTTTGIFKADTSRRNSGKQIIEPGVTYVAWNTDPTGTPIARWVTWAADGTTKLADGLGSSGVVTRTAGVSEHYIAFYTNAGATQTLQSWKETTMIEKSPKSSAWKPVQRTIDSTYLYDNAYGSTVLDSINGRIADDFLPENADSLLSASVVTDYFLAYEGVNMLDTSTCFGGYYNAGTPVVDGSRNATGKQPVLPGYSYVFWNTGADNILTISTFDAAGNYLRSTSSGNKKALYRKALSDEYYFAMHSTTSPTQSLSSFRQSVVFSFQPKPSAYVAPARVPKQEFLSNAIDSLQRKIAASALKVTINVFGINIQQSYNDTSDIVFLVNPDYGDNLVMSGVTATLVGPTTTIKLKSGGDDVGPIFFNGFGAIGGSYGMLQGFRQVTATSHGKANVDIGSQWQDGASKNWWLVEIVDANTLVFMAEDTSSTDIWAYAATTVTSNLTHVTGATNTGTVTVSGQTSYTMFPSVKNEETYFILDGTDTISVSETGVYYANAVECINKWDLVNPRSALDSIIAHVGSDPPSVYTDGDSMMTITNTIRFSANKSYLIFSEIALYKEIDLYEYGFHQFIAPDVNATYPDLRFYLPRTASSVSDGTNSYNFNTFEDVVTPAISAGINFTSARWETSTIPPNRAIFLIGDGTNLRHAFAHGYVPSRYIGIDSVRYTLINRAWNIGPGNKSYPYGIGDKLGNLPRGTYYGGMMYGAWVSLSENDAVAHYYDVTDRETIVSFDFQAQKTLYTLRLPEKYAGWNIETIYKSSNMNVQSKEVVNNKIVASSTDSNPAWATLKISK